MKKKKQALNGNSPVHPSGEKKAVQRDNTLKQIEKVTANIESFQTPLKHQDWKFEVLLVIYLMCHMLIQNYNIYKTVCSPLSSFSLVGWILLLFFHGSSQFLNFHNIDWHLFIIDSFPLFRTSTTTTSICSSCCASSCARDWL